MARASASDVAKFFISASQAAGAPITNLKLQKLLYYAQGWHLALFDSELFSERLEAWPHGPVVPPVYGEYKKYRWNPISEPVVSPRLDDELTKLLNDVMATYGIYDAYLLEMLSHQEEPWLAARGSLGPTEPSNAILQTEEVMKPFFKSIQ